MKQEFYLMPTTDPTSIKVKKITLNIEMLKRQRDLIVSLMQDEMNLRKLSKLDGIINLLDTLLDAAFENSPTTGR
jgi:hypothetical protein